VGGRNAKDGRNQGRGIIKNYKPSLQRYIGAKKRGKTRGSRGGQTLTIRKTDESFSAPRGEGSGESRKGAKKDRRNTLGERSNS